jgi:hypothetical protein
MVVASLLSLWDIRGIWSKEADALYPCIYSNHVPLDACEGPTRIGSLSYREPCRKLERATIEDTLSIANPRPTLRNSD